MSDEDGKLWIDGTTIKYTSKWDSWAIPLVDLKVFGESTNQNGPYTTDYFFIFVTGKEEGWQEASFYSPDREKFLKDLSTALNTELHLGLTFSADFASRILWPPQFSGKPLFDYLEKNKQPGFFSWVHGWFSTNLIFQFMTAEVRTFVGLPPSPPPANMKRYASPKR